MIEPIFEPLEQLLEEHFDRPFDSQPNALRERVTEAFYPLQWDELKPSGRRSLARQADARDAPSMQEQNAYFWQEGVQVSEVEQAIKELDLMRPQNVTEKLAKDIKMSELKAGLTNRPTPEPQAVPVAPVSASGGVVTNNAGRVNEGWVKLARERAVQIIERQRERDLYPSQENLGDEIAKEFRADGTVGTDGKPLSGGTIKRHALKGISSAKVKQLSTQTGRGKQGK